MTEILPRGDTTRASKLAGAVVVARFYEDICADTGCLSAAYSNSRRCKLYEINFRDSSARGFLVSPRARMRARVSNPYKTLQIQFDSEAQLRGSSLDELGEKIPQVEVGFFSHIEFMPIGSNCQGKALLEINFYNK